MMAAAAAIRNQPAYGRVATAIRQVLGDSRGRWEGDTLVVETTNFSRTSNLRGASVNLRLVERFTRVAADTLQYDFTATDPTIWVKPWTARILLKPSQGKIYEYACHEGNHALANVLSAHRATEKLAAEAAGKK